MSQNHTHPSFSRRQSGKILLIAILATCLLALIGAGVVGWMLLSGGSEEGEATEAVEAPPGPPLYFALAPAFTVNLADPGVARYMQAEVQLMTRDPEAVAVIEAHQPLLRNRLLLLFGQQTVGGLRSREDKERLQTEALNEVRVVLEEASGSPLVEALYFTSFVTE